jgi:hypothetical protein
MKVPYAKKWWRETDAFTTIVLGCGLVEELKWGKPCFTYQKKNVAIIIPLKEACVLSFFKGALLKDPKHVLQKIGASQAGRWIKFTSPKDIAALQSTLRSYLHEAIRVEKEGSPRESFGVRGSRGAAGQAECDSGAQGGVRSPHAGTQEVVHLSHLKREASGDAGRTGGHGTPRLQIVGK